MSQAKDDVYEALDFVKTAIGKTEVNPDAALTMMVPMLSTMILERLDKILAELASQNQRGTWDE